MKVITLTTNGVEPARLVNTNYPLCGSYMAFMHGISDVIIIPVFIHDGWNYNLVPLITDEDKFVLIRNGDNSTANDCLVLWYLSPDLLGDVDHAEGDAVDEEDDYDPCPCPAISYAVEGDAKIIATGYDADGCTPCPVIHVTGPCRLFWCRATYESLIPIMEAIFDGKEWTVRPINDERSNSTSKLATAD
jgi:hypothetical protein